MSSSVAAGCVGAGESSWLPTDEADWLFFEARRILVNSFNSASFFFCLDLVNRFPPLRCPFRLVLFFYVTLTDCAMRKQRMTVALKKASESNRNSSYGLAGRLQATFAASQSLGMTFSSIFFAT